MIYYFIKPSGGGKSALATAFSVQFLDNEYESVKDSRGLLHFLDISPHDRLKLSHEKIDKLNKMGYSFEKPEHCIQANFGIYTDHYGERIVNYDLPGYKLGLYDKKYKTKMSPPASMIIWDETQTEADGRESMSMPRRLRSFLSLHRKWLLDILCFSQRDKVDKNIRENCTIIMIEDMKHKKDKYGFIVSTTWTLLVFESYLHYELYKATLKPKYYQKTTYTFNGCIFDHFNSEEGEEYFIECAVKNGGLNLKKAIIDLTSKEKIDKYVTEHPYLPPTGYEKGNKKK